MRTITPIFAFLLFAGLTAGLAQDAPQLPRTPSPAGATVYFLSPADGAEVRSPFTVRFGLRGMGVAPAGVTAADTGHHHLFIDTETLPDEGQPLPPNSETVRHFGLGQTEAELTLPPGRHTLQLVLGDHLHIQHQPPVRSAKITITVVQ